MATLSNPSLTATISTDMPLTWMFTASYTATFTPQEVNTQNPSQFTDFLMFEGNPVDSTTFTPVHTTMRRHKKFTSPSILFHTANPVHNAMVVLQNTGLSLPSVAINTPPLFFGGDPTGSADGATF